MSVIKSFLCKKGFHKYTEIFNTGKYSYRECKRCGERIAKEIHKEGYQPLDIAWMAENRDDYIILDHSSLFDI